MPDTKLSKSMYTMGIKCPLSLWLRKNHKELFDDSVMNQAILNNGNLVGDLAMGLFGDYVEVPYDRGDLTGMVTRTQELLDAGTRVICEASFDHDGLFCSADILLRTADGFELYEVKSATSAKEINIHDVAYQLYVLRACGLTVNKACLVHLNREYVRHGALELDKLFTIDDVTEQVEGMQTEVGENITAMRTMILQPEPPVCPFNEDCFGTCGFSAYCTRELPEKNVFTVGGMQFRTKAKLYAQGIVSYDDMLANAKLNSKQKLIVSECENIDADAVHAFLDTLHYPLYFLDFETVTFPIPRWDDTRPYMQVPFQYSLHSIAQEGAPLMHTEFLADGADDPRRTLAERLCADIPDGSCVLAYNMSFEKSVIKALAELYPDLAEKLTRIHDSILDLMIPFRDMSYYLPAMHGSYSIKAVLPALYPDEPELDYHNLEDVHCGSEAADTFAHMMDMTEAERAILRANLLKYCGLDTYAMVKVLEKLKEV